MESFKRRLHNILDVNTWFGYGYPLIVLTSSEGCAEFVEVLLALGADVNNSDINGDTALHEASYYGKEDIVEILLKHEADTSLKNDNGSTARDIAVLGNNQTIVNMLDYNESSQKINLKISP